jgi:hypothetical protein
MRCTNRELAALPPTARRVGVARLREDEEFDEVECGDGSGSFLGDVSTADLITLLAEVERTLN